MIEKLSYLKNYYKSAAKQYIKAGRDPANKIEYRKIGLLNPSIGSSNLGDFIIQESVKSAILKLDDQAMITEFPTQMYLKFDAKSLMRNQDILFVGGTNLLSSNLNEQNQWKVDTSFGRYIKNKVVLLGCGWWQYQGKPNQYTSSIYQSLLSKNVLHSVRDQYTADNLRAAGIDNVVNTCCPTLWSLSQEHCRDIKKGKSSNVITTVTCYNKDQEQDCYLINTLIDNYEKVYVWIQGIEDLSYIHSLNLNMKSLYIVPPTLAAYDDVLSKGDIDYVGTRLHAGVRALKHKVRTKIVAVDNRAMEIGKDVNLNVVSRNDVECVIDFIQGDYTTEINLPEKSIAAWFASVWDQMK